MQRLWRGRSPASPNRPRTGTEPIAIRLRKDCFGDMTSSNGALSNYAVWRIELREKGLFVAVLQDVNDERADNDHVQARALRQLPLPLERGRLQIEIRDGARKGCDGCGRRDSQWIQ